ncbi:MAG: purine-nucleoside phosphorylase [Clostridia bacterium]|nr:purine-nucleoside phosphorylase [Clostridia bacterium]
MYKFADYAESANYIKSRISDFRPDVLMILGSGLGFMGDMVENPVYVEYKNIPNFKISTVPDHRGRLVFGKLAGQNVMVMQGRLHCYEGYEAADVAFPVRVAKLLGVHSMLITNASGGINFDYNVGDFMLISDHIRLFDIHPVRGENIEELGDRFFDMTYTYTEEYRQIAKCKAEELGIKIREGVYFYATGPQFETPAEIKAMRILGADAVGMSTIPEVITARHCGLKILGISLITNLAAGMAKKEVTVQEVNEEAEKAETSFAKLVMTVLPEMKG